MKTLTAERSCVVVKISDLGASNLPLEEQMRSLLGAAPYLVLDMDGIQITSMMLGELVNLYKSFEQRWGGKACAMVIIRAPEITKQVMRIARLAEKIPLYDDLDQAWRSFGSAPRAQALA